MEIEQLMTHAGEVDIAVANWCRQLHVREMERQQALKKRALNETATVASQWCRRIQAQRQRDEQPEARDQK